MLDVVALSQREIQPSLGGSVGGLRCKLWFHYPNQRFNKGASLSVAHSYRPPSPPHTCRVAPCRTSAPRSECDTGRGRGRAQAGASCREDDRPHRWQRSSWASRARRGWTHGWDEPSTRGERRRIMPHTLSGPSGLESQGVWGQEVGRSEVGGHALDQGWQVMEAGVV